MLVRRIVPLLGLCVLLCSAAVHAQVLIVAHPHFAAAEVSKTDLREVFTGAANTLKGAGQVTPVLLKGGSVHEQMLALYIGRSDSAFRAGWRSLLFSGEVVMPRTFDSEAALVEYIARTPGAVGYISKSTSHDGLKVVQVK